MTKWYNMSKNCLKKHTYCVPPTISLDRLYMANQCFIRLHQLESTGRFTVETARQLCRSRGTRSRLILRSLRWSNPSRNITHTIPWDWYIYLHQWHTCMVNVGKYTSPMEHMGNGKQWVACCWHCWLRTKTWTYICSTIFFVSAHVQNFWLQSFRRLSQLQLQPFQSGQLNQETLNIYEHLYCFLHIYIQLLPLMVWLPPPEPCEQWSTCQRRNGVWKGFVPSITTLKNSELWNLGHYP